MPSSPASSTSAVFIAFTLVTSASSLVPRETLQGAQSEAASLQGTVVSADGRPLAGAQIRFQGGSHQVRTDEAGIFRVAGLSAGTHELEVRHAGFAPLFVQLSIGPGQAIHLMRGLLTLERDPSGFAERKASGQGVFIERSQIEQWNPRDMMDLLRSIRGVHVGYSSTDATGRVGRVAQVRRATPGCAPVLFVDGLLVGSVDKIDVDAAVSPRDLRAFEVYRGPTEVPPRFNLPGSRCGVLVAWTGYGQR